MAEAKKTRKFLIIDANAVIHRAFHALPPLKTKKGEMVNAVYGFLLLFFKALKDIQPDCVVSAFDVHAPTFRHKAFKEYKAKRKKAPDELYQQIDFVKQVLQGFNIPVFEKPGFEADDLIGVICQQTERKQVLPKAENIILTGDMDALQLVNKQTKVYTMRRGLKDTVLYDTEKTKERYNGLEPKQLVDYRALRGDPSDNIPGVTGIGEKTAIKLLLEFDSLENLYKEIEKGTEQAGEIKKAVLEKLKQYKEQAFISQKLAQIEQNIDIDFKLNECDFDFDSNKAKNVLTRFEFFSLIKKLAELKNGGSAKEQGGLFAVAGKQEKIENKKENIAQEIKELKEQGVLSPELVELETKLIPIVEQMEKIGIKADKKCLKKLSLFLEKQIKDLENKIYDSAKIRFNPNSRQQVSDTFFSKLKISSQGMKKTPKGVISTGASELEKIKDKHPVVGLVLKYRELFKLKTGFVDSLPKTISEKDGRIHPDFHQLGTETGRMSCSNPNLQNIPIKTEIGNEIRKCFFPESGFVFVSADYSQIDLRVASVLSNDKKMLEFFKHGKDIHRMTASSIFEVEEKAVNKRQRAVAKTLNFGVLYGMGPHKFKQHTGLKFSEAKEFIERYFKTFNGIAEFVEKSIEQARDKGFNQTLFGRKRFLPEIDSRDQRIRAQAERIARNFPVQGTSADIIKMAMNKISEKGLLNNDCRMLLQIHDELLFEIKKDKAKEVGDKIKKIMENVVELKTAMDVDLKIGKSWGELKNVVE